MAGDENDALTAATAWLRKWGLCPHDTGLHVVCPECAASLAAVMRRLDVARLRRELSTQSAEHTGETPAIEALRAECDRLISRMHSSLDVAMDCQHGEPEENTVAVLAAIRVALLKLSFGYFGDPEAEETLAAEGHDV